MADHGGGEEYPGGADQSYGSGYPGGIDHGGSEEYSSGSDHECGGSPSYGHGDGSRPLGGEIEGDIEQPAGFDPCHNTRMEFIPKEYGSADDNSSPGFLTKPAKLAKLAELAKPVLRRLQHCLIVTPLVLGYIFIVGDTKELLSKSDINDLKPGGIASAKSKKPGLKTKMQNLTLVTLVRMGFVISIWMVINLSVPTLRRVPLLGSQLWKWSLLTTLASLGYPFFYIQYFFIHGLSRSSYSEFRGSNVEYCMTGLAQSVIQVQYFTTILIVWLLCINTSNAPLHKYVSMTLTSFLVGVVLSVVRSAVLLWWKAKLIYRKYEGKILSAGCQLFFCLIIVERNYRWATPPLIVWAEPMRHKLKPSSTNNSNDEEDHDGQATEKRRKILPIEEYMLRKHVSLEYIHEVATCLTNNFELTLTEDDDIPDIAPILRGNFASPEFSINGACMRAGLTSFGLTLLQDLLEAEGKKDGNYEEFEEWMVNGLKNCYKVGNRINGAMDAMRLLDRVLTGLIVLVAILIWIFITGFATTRVVVGLASMFLGLTFVFGDTCKTFFQGVIFSFVTHPFDVGDRCIIDDKELKVKKTNILTTTFFGSQSKEVVIYPNSDLSNKHIIILGEEVSESKPKVHDMLGPQLAELEDVIELILPCTTKALHIKSLQTKIEGYLEDGIESHNHKKPYWITFNETGEGIKMGVHFHHNLNNGDEGVGQLETLAIRKEKHRSKFFLQLKELLENIENEV